MDTTWIVSRLSALRIWNAHREIEQATTAQGRLKNIAMRGSEPDASLLPVLIMPPEVHGGAQQVMRLSIDDAMGVIHAHICRNHERLISMSAEVAREIDSYKQLS